MTEPLLDLVLDCRDALEKLHILVPGKRPLDVLPHQPAGYIFIRSVARSKVRDDLFLGPLPIPVLLSGVIFGAA